MKNNDLNSRLVYSTSLGSICQECTQPINDCICHKIKKAAAPDNGGVLRISRQTRGRKGKTATLITGLTLNETGLLDLAKRLKQRFGIGGSMKDYTIELQGDFREQAAQELRKLGFLK